MKACLHCGSISKGSFCCSGCEWVYGYLHSENLSHFYDLRRLSNPIANGSALPVGSKAFAVEEDEFSVVGLEGVAKGEFYLEGMHCSACVWLTEQLPRFVPEVRNVATSLSTSMIQVEIDPARITDKQSTEIWRKVVRQLRRMGYRPRPLLKSTDRDDLEKERAELKDLAMRLAVAAFCAGNIMISAVALYSGASHEHALLFSWATGILFLPVYLYCFFPYLRSVWKGLLCRSFSNDFPVCFGVTLGTVVSYWNLMRWNSATIVSPLLYFDSLSGLVFLLLTSQWIQRSLMRKAKYAAASSLQTLPQAVRQIQEDGQLKLVTTDQLVMAFCQQKNDPVTTRLLVRPGEMIPFNGVAEGAGLLSSAYLTGEVQPKWVSLGDSVWGGSVLEGTAPLVIKLVGSGEPPTLHSALMQESEKVTREFEFSKSRTRKQLEQVTRAFSMTSFIAAVALVFLAWFEKRQGAAGELGWTYRAIALTLVSCPCAFLFGFPLLQAKAASIAARLGLWVRDASIFENLVQVSTIIFDKTGTLTSDHLITEEIENYRSGEVESELESTARLYLLQKRAEHPIALALLTALEERVGKDVLLRVVSRIGLEGDWKETGLRYQEVTFQRTPENSDTVLSLPKTIKTMGWFGIFEKRGVKKCGGFFREVDGSSNQFAATPYFYAESSWIPESETLQCSSIPIDSLEANFETKIEKSPVILNPILKILFSEGVRSEVPQVFNSLRDKKLVVLSGDQQYNVEKLVSTLNEITQGKVSAWKANCTPLEKAEFVEWSEKTQKGLMIGDGLNDRLAFQSATVSIAVRGGVRSALQAADAVAVRPGLAFLPMFFSVAKRHQVAANFLIGFTLLYNLVAMVLAVLGILGPLTVALFMPVSALVIFLTIHFLFREGKIKPA